MIAVINKENEKKILINNIEIDSCLLLNKATMSYEPNALFRRITKSSYLLAVYCGIELEYLAIQFSEHKEKINFDVINDEIIPAAKEYFSRLGLRNKDEYFNNVIYYVDKNQCYKINNNLIIQRLNEFETAGTRKELCRMLGYYAAYKNTKSSDEILINLSKLFASSGFYAKNYFLIDVLNDQIKPL